MKDGKGEGSFICTQHVVKCNDFSSTSVNSSQRTGTIRNKVSLTGVTGTYLLCSELSNHAHLSTKLKEQGLQGHVLLFPLPTIALRHNANPQALLHDTHAHHERG